jgi:hypothetical protein
MTKREEIKDKYKTGAAFVADISKRTMLILQELNASRRKRRRFV